MVKDSDERQVTSYEIDGGDRFQRRNRYLRGRCLQIIHIALREKIYTGESGE